MMKNLYVGVDVSKSKLDICIYDGVKTDYLTILNNEESIKGFIEFLKNDYSKYSYYFGYEATSTYMINLKKILSIYDIKQILINPFTMSHYLKHLDSRIKNDMKDSFGIAKYIMTLNKDSFKTSFNADSLHFKKLSATRNLLEKLSTQLKNLIHSQKNIESPELDNMINELKENIKNIRKKIEKMSCDLMYKLYPQTKEIISNIKGVGSSLLLELVPIFLNAKNYTLNQLQCYVGLSPREFQSGSSISKKGKMSKRGNSLVRKKLYLSAMVAIRFNQIIKQKYQRLIDNGKSKMVALVACMCHLFRAVFIHFNKYEFENETVLCK
jgi:transposase